MTTDDQWIEQIYQQHSRRVLATLIRLLGDFTLAEEAMQEAFTSAVRQWRQEGFPDNPSAWLIRAGHRRGIDHIRRSQTAQHYSHLIDQPEETGTSAIGQTFDDDQLRLLFTCCHPALPLDARVALTLREMCGLTTEQVASGLLQKPATLAQRIVRAKRKIRDAGIPYEVPEAKELPERLPGVLRVIYLVFNEGYSRSDGEQIFDVHLSAEAIRLAEVLARLLPEGEVFGLLALMQLQNSRQNARQDNEGNLITLEDQDRSLWDQASIDSGFRWLEAALARTPTGPYTLQASIAAVHAEAPKASETNWARIVRLYNALYQQQPSPVIALNRAVAIAMRDTPADGLQLLEELMSHKAFAGYHLFHAARADLQRRAGNLEEARQSYERALGLVSQGPERRFLERRLTELEKFS
ncbi:RNA polymerase subunit sigma-24 [Marinobacter sp. EhC06]|jgi:RNA polymerase sigma-70 factor (ECF subfamily)|uniref:RNA polymerase sigma factor n=1 Tax=Marinobacter TaxID=2742 RepID=UPI0007DA01C7|nr:MULTISPECIES: RNA polymerase sigma factor [unclassified Marinobacter]OAN93693.1 RNA polymerase subunit sigma-24 [Marinobacter sp. EhC06]OAN94712.1 RNA polymerase subunit sigma-24 [Marinobacter sp. EhN04]